MMSVVVMTLDGYPTEALAFNSWVHGEYIEVLPFLASLRVSTDVLVIVGVAMTRHRPQMMMEMRSPEFQRQQECLKIRLM